MSRTVARWLVPDVLDPPLLGVEHLLEPRGLFPKSAVEGVGLRHDIRVFERKQNSRTMLGCCVELWECVGLGPLWTGEPLLSWLLRGGRET